MPLIEVPSLLPDDLQVWRARERNDRRNALSPRLARREDAAIATIADFFHAGDGYVGVSWGKDSVVVAHLARRVSPDLPLVWVRVEPIGNPHCVLVRDAFLAAHPGLYDEMVVQCQQKPDGSWSATGTLEQGFAVAAARYGDRYVSGIRSEESIPRRWRQARWGTTSARTCAPITRWSASDVFAYLVRHDLPVHPVYAMSRGGNIERGRLRVASLGGKRGTEWGRREWEAFYFRAELEALGEALRV